MGSRFLKYVFLFVYLAVPGVLQHSGASIFLAACELLAVACGILLLQPGAEPMPSAVDARSLNHWITREVPSPVHFLLSSMWSESAMTPTTWLIASKELQCAWLSGGPSVLISPRLSVELRRWVPLSASRHLLLSQHLYPQAFLLFILPPSGPLLLSLLG